MTSPIRACPVQPPWLLQQPRAKTLRGNECEWLRKTHHDFIEQGFAELEAEARREAERQRRHQLATQVAAAFTPTLYFIGDHHEELEEAGVEHDPPPTFPVLQNNPLPAPLTIPVAAGHLGALTQFRPFEELNYGPVRPRRNPIFRVQPNDSGYERLRDSALGQ